MKARIEKKFKADDKANLLATQVSFNLLNIIIIINN